MSLRSQVLDTSPAGARPDRRPASHRRRSPSSRLALRYLPLALLCANATPASAQQPFPCSGEVLIVQDANAQLHQIDQSTTRWSFFRIGGRAGVEYNSLGFRSSDRMLYAVELHPAGNTQLVKIDRTGAVFGLGRPAGLPTDVRFDAGDVTPDGETMYVTVGAVPNAMLYAIDLTAAGFPQRPGYPIQITGDDGAVHDWAVDPVTGLLFGGDKTDGELAVLDPVTGRRTDHPGAGAGALALPTGSSYGAAWFDAAGNPELPFSLYLYRNDGEILQVAVDGQPSVDDVRAGPASNRNDGAICRQEVLGTALEMTASSGPLPLTVTLDYVIENLDGLRILDDLAADQDLEEVFGTHGTDWTFTSISSTPAVAANPAFDGHSDLRLLASGQDLAPGSTVTVTVALELPTLDRLPADGYFCNQILASGAASGGAAFADLSTAGSVPDPNGDGRPSERQPTCLDLAPPLPCGAFVVQHANSQLYRVDPSVASPAPVGGPTGREINAIGYRRADELIYGLELGPTGNVQIVRLDGDGKVYGLGRPFGLPGDVRFDAGDVVGDTLYVTGHNQPLYRISLASLPILPAATSVAVSSHGGVVNDWAYDPISGWLIGGDQTDGEVAFLNPGSGRRIDNPSFGPSSNVLALPQGSAYGAAWLARSGEPFSPFDLFLYRNAGEVLEMGFGIHLSLDDSHAAASVSRNDGAACVD